MEVVEIIVYIAVAIILGGLILVVTMELASPQVYENIREIFTGEQEQEFSVITNETAAQFLFSFWEQCNFGVTPENITFQYQGESLSKEEIFDQVKRLRLCNTLSSAEYDCGSREDLTINISSGSFEEGILVASCFREDRTGALQVCKGSGCEPAPEVLVPQEGMCGSYDNSEFSSDTTGWPTGSFCEQGAVYEEPDFPEQGSTTEWICLGIHGGDNVTCNASVEEAEGANNDEGEGGPSQTNTNDMIDSTNPVATINTTLGVIKLELFASDMPYTVENFVSLADDEFYDGTKFHRVITGFIIQGGDPNTREEDTSTYGQGGPGYSIDDEFVEGEHLRNREGTIAMANEGEPNSGGSQFFINVADNDHLDFDNQPTNIQHPVFGQVIEGFETVQEIEGVETGDDEIPIVPVVVETITITAN